MATQLTQILSPRYRLLSHVLFWIAYVGVFTLIYGSAREEYGRSLAEILWTLPVKMMAVYFTIYVLLPRFMYTKQYISFSILFVLTAVLFGYLDRLVLHLAFVPKYFPDYDYSKYPLTSLSRAFLRMIHLYIVVFAAVTIKLFKRNYQNEKLTEELAKEKLDAELKFLKGQIHPHFLFNTLNNLYALTLQNSPNASEVVLKLSNLLDYMLYECNVPKVPLSKEITQLDNFIVLEKLRYGDRLEVSFSTSGELQNKYIPPLLLLPFVENAFKHGASQDSDNSFITIDITVRGDQMTFKVENSKSPDDGQSSAGYTKGIGLRNVRRRLDLLFQNNYSLQVFEEEETYLIVLRLDLDSGQPASSEQLEAAEVIPS